jgi:two-component system phosphate regulon sensor histidine kinase PhoR
VSFHARLLLGASLAVAAAVGPATWLMSSGSEATLRVFLATLGAAVTGVSVAALLAWHESRRLQRQLELAKRNADRYRQGDFSRPPDDYGSDEIGELAGLLDDVARETGQRLTRTASERAHLDAILTGMAEGVLLVNHAGRLLLANPALRRMLALTADLDGRHYLEVVRHPDVAAQLASALKGSAPPGVEIQLSRAGGRTFMAHAVPIGADRGGGAVLVLHDVTDLRRADQVRRDFVANVSHELRTPLTAIRGYVEALLDGPSTADARRFMEVIARHTLRMERLVSDLLRLARLDAGQETADRVPCAVSGLVTAAEHDLHTVLEARKQRVVTSVGDGAETISVDAAKFHDVLRNLLENASNYSPEGGTIEVTIDRTEDGLRIRVADRGPGIPEADLTRIFERFYRVDRSRTRDPGGTGLGLSIVRHLVQLHGGRVSAANREGGGALFTVILPAVPPEVGQEPEEPSDGF